MYNMLLGYVIFIFVVAFLLVLTVPKLKIKNPLRFISIIMFLVLAPIVISYFYFTSFAPIPETMVPDVVGLSEIEAIGRIEKMGLDFNVERKDDSSNVVTYQRPEPGKVVKAGRVVSIVIGKSGTEMPIPSSVVVTPNATPENTATSDVQIEMITGEGVNQ